MIEYEVKKTIGILSVNNSWQKELNLVSWNGQPAKLDIRSWSPDHKKMGKGVTLSEEEGEKLLMLLGELQEKQNVEEEEQE